MKKTNEQICEEVLQIRNIDEVKTYKLCFTDGTSCVCNCTERNIIMDDDIDCYYDMDDEE